MTLKIRRVIYISFITIFLIAVPMIAMYATGYRYNFKKNQIEKTGIIVIKSTPKNAQISINNRYKGNTPKRFSRILPDSYDVTVSKDGYHSWNKKLQVESNLTVFAQDIVLFKNNLPLNIIDGEINIFTTSPDNTKLIYSVIKENTEELRLLNLQNNSDFLIEELNIRSYNDLVVNSWSQNQNKLLLNQQIGEFNKFLIIEADNLKIKELFDITRINFDKVSWSDNDIYGLRKAVLHKIDLNNSTIQTLLSANITDFQVQNNNIFYIEKVARDSFLNKVTLVNGTLSEIEQIKLPSPSNFSLHESPRGVITLIDNNNHDLFIIKEDAFADQDIENNIILQDNAKNIVWSDDNKKILYYNDFEITVFDIESKNKNLITRYGEFIDQASWYDDNYILYQINNSLKVIESSYDEQKNDTTLSELSTIKKVTIDNDSNNLYIHGSAGAQQGIYKLEIQ